MQGEIQRLVSRNHQVHYELSGDKKSAKVNIKEMNKFMIPTKDFILLINDQNVHTPTAFSCLNKDNE